jgi:hypothetical protein
VIPAFDATRPWLAALRPWIDRLPVDRSVAEALNAVAAEAAPRFVAQTTCTICSTAWSGNASLR